MNHLLMDALAGWLRLAGEKQVYVEYRFAGAAPGLYAVSPAVLEGLDGGVRGMIEACSKLPECERWMNLELSRDGEGLTLACSASGDCELPPGAWIHPGLQIVFRQEEGNVRLEVKARTRETEGTGQGGTPLRWKEELFPSHTLTDGHTEQEEETT